MAKPRPIRKSPPRYRFLLNPYTDIRLSKCPRCQRPTHFRKFALLILIKGWGSLALGKTCRYCTPCELIIAHQNELEAELAQNLSKIAPEQAGNEFLVVGTMDKRVWKRGLESESEPFEAMLSHMAEFKGHYKLGASGGWGPA